MVTYLWIDTFGTLQLRSQNKAVSHFPTQHSKELLAFLLVNPFVKHTRLKLISLLWPEISEKTGRGRLNTELWRLRTLFRQIDILPEEILYTDRECLTFSPSKAVLIDCDQFELLIKQAVKMPDIETKEMTFNKAVGLYKGDFCEDVFSDWCIIKRERLARTYLNVFGQLMHYAIERKAYQDAIAYGETILNSDPLREEVHRALMLCYIKLGSFPDVVRQFQLCSQILQDELRVVPLPETVALFDQVMINRYKEHASLKHPKKERQQLRQKFLQYQEVSAQLSRLIK